MFAKLSKRDLAALPKKLRDRIQKRASRNARKGGIARADSLTSKRRSEIARIAARARWERSDRISLGENNA